MRCMDLTHLISREMPVYPGTEPPRLQPANTYERDGFQETLLTMYSHTGTHRIRISSARLSRDRAS